MKNIPIFILALIFYPIQSFGNCELSWVSEWDKDINWFHTSAVYPENVSNTGFVPPKVRQIATANGMVNVRCTSDSEQSCDEILSINYVKDRCAIDTDKTSLTKGESDHDMGNILQYARKHIDNCTNHSFTSEIAILENDGNLSIPKTYYLHTKANEPSENVLDANLTEIMKIGDLKTIQYTSNQELDIRSAKFELIDYFSDVLGNKILTLNAVVYMANENEICVDCNTDQPEKKLPIIVGYINNEWLLIGNGSIGQCSGYKEGAISLSRKMDIPFGLPSNFVLYDIEGDKQIDLMSFIPRSHLSGTKYVYSISNNKLINVSELCTIKDQCRPEAGC